MARGRILNREVARDGKVAAYGEEFGPLGLVFHHRIIAFLDVNGNVRGDPWWLKAEVMPRVADCSPEDCRRLARGLVAHELAILYEVDGMPYLHFPRFRDNQPNLRTDRETPEVPVPEGFDESAGTLPADFPRDSRDIPGNFPPHARAEVEVKDKTPPVSPPAGGENGKASRKRRVALPTDWEPNDTHQRIATEERVELAREAKKFRDHAEATGRVLKDWDAGFRNWLRNAAEFGARSPPKGDTPWYERFEDGDAEGGEG